MCSPSESFLSFGVLSIERLNEECIMRPLIVGNWKMHGLAPQLREIEAVAVAVVASSPVADILLCLPATLIARGARTAAGRIAIGGENCHPDAAGAFTGDISAEMLRDAGSRPSSSGIRSAASIMARRTRSSRQRQRPRGARGFWRSSASARRSRSG
jgi:hypothetical protein